jgi:hypothetical protein
MRNLMGKMKLIAILAITALLVVIAVLNLRDRLSPKYLPDDGIEWADTENGVQVHKVRADSPLAFVIKKGDYLRVLFYNGKFEEVKHSEDVYRYLNRLGVGSDARYVIEREDPVLQSLYGIDVPLYDADFKIVGRSHIQINDRSEYLPYIFPLIGLVYLAIGLFVLFRQGRAALTYHFYAWFLLSFICYFYTQTREGTELDKVVFLLDSAALALLAPTFLHFCANFQTGRRLSLRVQPLVALLYLPALALVALEILWNYKASFFPGGRLVQARDWLNWAEILHYILFFLAGGVLLVRTFVKAARPLLRQQLKWIIWGLGLSVLPLTLFYAAPYLIGFEITKAMEVLATAPLVLIPLSFGYSIIRYRLMDVDVIMRRSFVHVVAITAAASLYMVVLLGVGDLIKFIWATADLNSWKTRVFVVIGMLIVTVLFAPIKNKLQTWADRWFYGERYTLRTGLQDFGRTLSQTTALPQLLDSLVRRLSDMLSVRKVAIFIEDMNAPSGFRLAHSSDVEGEIGLPDDIKRIIRVGSIGRGFILASDLNQLELDIVADSDSIAGDISGSDELYYYFPCVVRDRMIAIIGVGKTASGALLTSEDTGLLRALSGYVAVAIDNSLLYRSEREKAEELSRLKEFSENIIESVNVGILVVDFDGRITTWNSALEEIFGVNRERALRRNIRDVMDADLVETMRNATGERGWSLSETRHIYKFNASTEDGRPLTLNISLAPFEVARGVIAGAIIVIENVTERAQLEEQLLQREKLSSIGLLAAGVAHEVNTPLAGISSYAQMLLQQVSDQDPKHKLLEKIHRQTLRASGIVNNLLNFSRTGDAQFRETDINVVLEDTLQLLEPQLRSANMEVVRHYGQDLPAAYGSASKLQQVFMNLVINARDAMPAGGRLTISTRLVDTSLVVDFRDTGVGIAPENIARIYDPFFTTKEVGQGTGLGLALSYGIIQEHGGRIFVESRPGEGAHFTIKLPTAFARQMQAASD